MGDRRDRPPHGPHRAPAAPLPFRADLLASQIYSKAAVQLWTTATLIDSREVTDYEIEQLSLFAYRAAQVFVLEHGRRDPASGEPLFAGVPPDMPDEEAEQTGDESSELHL